VTAQKASEYVLATGLFGTVLPRVGQYLRCPGRTGTAVLLSAVRTVGGDTKPMLRLIGLRVRAPQIPPDAVVVEWPKVHRTGIVTLTGRGRARVVVQCDYAAFRVQVSSCQTLKASDRISR
jgi:hypothetical protein